MSMDNCQGIKPPQVYELISRVSLSIPEKRCVFAVASQVVQHRESSEVPLYKALLEAAVGVRDPASRTKYISRIVARLNRESAVQHELPKRKLQKDTSALGSADINQGNWGVLIPALLILCRPSALRLALLMAYKMGFGKHAIDAQLLVGDRQLEDDGAFSVPIAKFDNKHRHILWLPVALEEDVSRCLDKIGVYENQSDLNKVLGKLKKELIREFNARKAVNPKDRSAFAAEIRRLGVLPSMKLEDLTMPRLLEAARVHGVAMSFPGYLRDMLNQPILPASVERIRLKSMLFRPLPASPNVGKRNTRPVDRAVNLERSIQDKKYLDLLSNADGLPDDVWSEWQYVTQSWVKDMVQTKPRETKVQRDLTVEWLRQAKYMGRNSWCVWSMQFLLEEGRRQSWAKRTWLQYRSILLSPEVSAFASTVDVEEFDDEDLALLIDEIKARKNSTKTLKRKIALICRMIKFAQEKQSDFAFPLVSITFEGNSPQLNKRAHILSPAEMEGLVARQIDVGNIDEAIVLGLIGFAGMRPIEIMYLQKAGITRLKNTLEINIERSKTPAGKRCLPVRNLAPKSIHEFLLEQLTERCDVVGSEDLFSREDIVKADRRGQLIDPALDALRQEFGEGIDLYTLRHGFASWSFLRLVMGAHDDKSVLNESPNLKHEVFNLGLKPFAELVFQQMPFRSDPNVFYRLARLMGHATPETLPRTYLHSVGLVHGSFLAEGPSLGYRSS